MSNKQRLNWLEEGKEMKLLDQIRNVRQRLKSKMYS